MVVTGKLFPAIFKGVATMHVGKPYFRIQIENWINKKRISGEEYRRRRDLVYASKFAAAYKKPYATRAEAEKALSKFKGFDFPITVHELSPIYF
jgi:hypothetical protein